MMQYYPSHILPTYWEDYNTLDEFNQVMDDEIREATKHFSIGYRRVPSINRWEPRDGTMKRRILAHLTGRFPPYEIGEYAHLPNWPQYVGLVLLFGFHPTNLVGMGLDDLMELKGEDQLYEILTKRYLPNDTRLEQLTKTSPNRLRRLDGLGRGHNPLDVHTGLGKWIGDRMESDFFHICGNYLRPQ